jgi:hypothetical protein
MTTPAERREAARLRSERWRRAHGIMPRLPAQACGLRMVSAEAHSIGGASRPREREAVAAVFDRLEWQLGELRVALDRATYWHAESAAILARF